MLSVASDTDVESATLTMFGPPLWHAGWVEGGWPIPDVDRIQGAIQQVLDGDPSVLGDPSTVRAGEACGL